MGLGTLLLSIAALCLLTEAIAKPQYALSTPAQLNSGKNGRACINIVGINEPIDVIVVLEHNGKNTSIIEQNVASPVYFQCNEFPIPKVSASVPVAMIFSATGKNTDMRDRKSVVIKPNSNFCLVQMDKPIYRPGQKVNFRIVCLTPQLKPVNEKYRSVYLQEPSRAKVAQWLNKESDHGVVSLEFSLIKDATPGSYIITAERESGFPVVQWFRVEEYVTPRYGVRTNAPQTVSVLAEDLKMNVSAMYTFGEPVPGTVTIRYCKNPEYYGRRQNCFRDKGRFCSNITGELGSDGSYTGVIDLLAPSMRTAGRGTSINLDVTVIEKGTGTQVTETHYVYITSQPANVEFDYDAMNSHYKRGIKYSVVAILKDESSNPIPNEELILEIGHNRHNTSTGADGRAVFEVDTSNMVAENFTAKVSYQNPDQCYYAEWRDADYPSVEYTVYRFYSKSGSFLQLKRPKGELTCGQSHKVDVDYIISPEGAGNGAAKATFYYLILSSSNIVQNGQKDVDLTGSLKGTFSFEVQVTHDLAPSADMIVYAMLQEEMIADTAKLNIEKCFKNKVSMTFSEEKGTPGSNVDAQLSGDPNSVCGLRVIDSGLRLLNPYESFTADTIFNSMRTWYYGYNVDGLNVEDPEPPCEDPDKMVFFNGSYYLPVSSPSEGDTYNKLKEIGLIVGTGAIVRKPVVCDKNPPPFQIARPIGGLAKAVPEAADRLSMNFAGGAGGAAPIETVRTNFAETFMWIMKPLDAEGRGTVTEKAPDSITKWEGSAFCMSDEGGFGMTKYAANYTTFLPFFGEMTLPYSCIRGETLVVVGMVRNYLDDCVKVEAILADSADYKAVLKDGVQGACICANDRATYTWEVDFNKIGQINFTMTAQTTHIAKTCDGPNDPSKPPRKDTVVQSFLVEPEGVQKQVTLSNLVSVKDKKYTKHFKINTPSNVVPGSASAFVTAVGDIVGLSLHNLQDMLQKPHGCAEQNLAGMATIPPVLKYLNNTGQLTEEMLQKGKAYMSEGYYRQLSFRHGGYYNLFRSSLEQGNSWLTAYTFKTFEACKEYIYIDESVQQQSLIELENSQRLDNGCFKARGNLVTTQDSDVDLHFTTYLAITLLQSNYSLGQTLLEGALECLKNASQTEHKIADQILMVYAFTLAKMWDYRKPLFDKVMKKAVTKDGTMYWEEEQLPKRPGVPFVQPIYSSRQVEMTGYMLLSIDAGPTVSENDMNTMAQIAIGLVRKMNPYGGFVSTQDSVVGMHALATFAKRIYVPNAHHNVVVSRGNSEVAKFDLNKDNRLLVQRHPLPDTNGEYNLDVSGSGWCLIQTTVGYNIPVPKENSAFTLEVKTSSDNCLNKIAYTFNMNMSISYHGQREESGMTLIQIRMLSGYKADYSSLNKLVSDKVISKAEENARGHVILYLEKVPKEPLHFSITAMMMQRVLNVKSSSVYIYRYYEEDENGYATYHHPCSATE